MNGKWKCGADEGSGCSRPDECVFHCVKDKEDQKKLDLMQQDILDPRNPKDIAGQSKPQYHAVPVTEGVARVMMLGVRKYGLMNWREKKIAYTAYISACMRHLKAFNDGETYDPESGELHTDHAAACMLILSDAIHNDTAIDDRGPPARKK